MSEIEWSRYPLVAENDLGRRWLQIQRDLSLAQNTAALFSADEWSMVSTLLLSVGGRGGKTTWIGASRAFSQAVRSSLRYTRLHAISSVANNCRASLAHLRCLPSSRDVRPVGQHDSDRK